MKTDHFPEPTKDAIIYEDEKLYACLANQPITPGHVVVVWKEDVADLHLLSREDYEYLMDKVDQIRNAMLQVLKIEKCYLVYMDEAKHVHWHLVPRYKEAGFAIFEHTPGKLHDLSLAKKIAQFL